MAPLLVSPSMVAKAKRLSEHGMADFSLVRPSPAELFCKKRPRHSAYADERDDVDFNALVGQPSEQFCDNFILTVKPDLDVDDPLEQLTLKTLAGLYFRIGNAQDGSGIFRQEPSNEFNDKQLFAYQVPTHTTKNRRSDTAHNVQLQCKSIR